MKKVFSYIDGHKGKFIDNLRDAVAIKSMSAFPESRESVVKMAEWIVAKLKELDATVELVEIGKETLADGSQIDLPPVILGQRGNDPAKKTVLVYCHYDVQPAKIEDGWATDPFVLTEIDGKLFGRGTTDDKGPLLGWLHVLEAFKNEGLELPVNLKFCFEGMEESQSQGLSEMIIGHKDTDFMKNIDAVCISDVFWLGDSKPCLSYGLRGLCYFFIEVEGCAKDLHSGVFGGTVHEALADVIAMMNTLVDEKGVILVEGLMDSVEPLTSKEEELYEKIDFDVKKFQDDIGTAKMVHGLDKKKVSLPFMFPTSPMDH